jgi:hypothetical protein
MSTVGRTRGDSVPARAEGRTDGRGMVTFCELPSGRDITVSLTHPHGGSAAPMRVTIKAREVRHIDLVLARRAPTE